MRLRKKEETKKAVAEEGQHEGDVGEAVVDKPLRSKSNKLILKEQVVSIKFNNNEINTWEGFDEGLATAMANSKGLQFLDASFNKLQTIGTCLSEYADLRVLYLHGNAISRLKDIDRLKTLKQIRKLTLHGNPVEDNKNYRKYVIYALPSLQQLDFTPITGLDRDHAKTWADRLMQKIMLDFKPTMKASRRTGEGKIHRKSVGVSPSKKDSVFFPSKSSKRPISPISITTAAKDGLRVRKTFQAANMLPGSFAPPESPALPDHCEKKLIDLEPNETPKRDPIDGEPIDRDLKELLNDNSTPIDLNFPDLEMYKRRYHEREKWNEPKKY